MNTTHTPGPWKILHTPTRKETLWAITTTGDAPVQAVICLVDRISKAHLENPAMAEANARLIAAAPALLASLQVLVADCEQNLRDIGDCDHSVGICCCAEQRNVEQAREAIQAATGKENP